MANESLIRGAAMAAPKFNPAAESFQKGFASSFEGISKSYAEEAEKLKALEEKRAKDAEKLYADKPLVEEGKIPSKFQKPFAQASMNLKNQYADLVKNKASMDPLEFIDKQNEYKSKVDGLNKQINALAEWQADFIETSGETGNDLWSQSMTADEQSLVQSIFDGELPMENRDGVVGFVKGKDFYPLDNLPKPKVKADIENNALSLQAEALGEIAAKGYDPKGYTFQNKLKSLKRGIDALNKDTAMSLYVDFAKAAGENGVVADRLKEMPLEEIKNKIYDFYKSPAEQIGAEAYKEYQRRNRKTDTDGDFLTKAERSKIILAQPTANKIQQAALTVKTADQFKSALKSISAQKGSALVTRKQAQEKFVKEGLIEQKEEEKKAKLAGMDYTPKTNDELKSEFNDLYSSNVPFFMNGSPLEVDLNNPSMIRQALWEASGLDTKTAQYYTATDLATNVPEANQTPSQPQPESEEATQDQTTITSTSGNSYNLQ